MSARSPNSVRFQGRLVCAAGCALCGEPVSSPHYCTADLEQAHAKWLLGNQRYRAAMAAADAETELARAKGEYDYNPPREGISDLCEWGDYRAGRTALPNARAITRAENILGQLTPGQVAELSRIYVDLNDVQRQALRGQRSGARRNRKKQTLSPLTFAEQVYLDVCKRSLKSKITSIRFDIGPDWTDY